MKCSSRNQAASSTFCWYTGRVASESRARTTGALRLRRPTIKSGHRIWCIAAHAGRPKWAVSAAIWRRQLKGGRAMRCSAIIHAALSTMSSGQRRRFYATRLISISRRYWAAPASHFLPPQPKPRDPSRKPQQWHRVVSCLPICADSSNWPAPWLGPNNNCAFFSALNFSTAVVVKRRFFGETPPSPPLCWLIEREGGSA